MDRREALSCPSPLQASLNSREFGWHWIWRLAVVAWLIGGIVVVTWMKAINYPWAATKAAEAVGHWRQSDLSSSLADLDRAIELVPDVPIYYNWRASIYTPYRFNEQGPRRRIVVSSENILISCVWRIWFTKMICKGRRAVRFTIDLGCSWPIQSRTWA